MIQFNLLFIIGDRSIMRRVIPRHQHLYNFWDRPFPNIAGLVNFIAIRKADVAEDGKNTLTC